MNDKDKVLVCVCLTSLFALVVHVALGITEAVILNNNLDAKNECGPAIWSCICACCVIHFIVGFYTFFNTMYKLTIDPEAKDNQTINLASAAFTVWAMVCYYRSGSDCVELFTNVYPSLWKMVVMEVVLFYIGLCFLGLLIVIGCCAMCCNVASERHNVSSGFNFNSPGGTAWLFSGDTSAGSKV
jgi:hypothetical protein